ncbi:MAG: hypothetical protein HN576_00180 [Bacteriovoracaceae bacterium]|jgi:hypothetical protein|nr:hypothetical protein [Bacteriovoracaceae bacterium]
MERKLFITIFFTFLIYSSSAFALMELSGSFSYDRTVYGTKRQNKSIDRTWAGTIALFLYNYTAIELNYSYNDEIITENEIIPVDGFNLNLISTQSKVHNEVFGVGIRQVFTGKNATIKPSLSLGYAKQFITSTSSATYQDTSNSDLFLFHADPSKLRVDSVFGTFSLQIRISGRLSLKGSVNTLFPASDINQAKDNLKYSVGFSWYL